MEDKKPIFVTINTDAGFYPYDKVGSFAYWIRGHNIFLKGSGMFKNEVHGAWHAEMQAMINALEVLRRSNPPPIIGFIFNRDNIYAKTGKTHELRKRLKIEISKFRSDAVKRLGKPQFKSLTKNQKNYSLFRHVKSHTDTDDKRSYVNRWCDSQCRIRLKEWKEKQKQNKFEAK